MSKYNKAMLVPSARPPRGVLKQLLIALQVGIAIGCTGARQPKPAVEVPRIAAFLPQDLQPVPPPSLPTADRLALLHKALTSPGDPHDVFLELARIGDATSVPSLIEALAQQGPASTAPYVLPGGGRLVAAGICTRSHCLEALRAITNHDAGPDAEDWRSWYEANGAKNQEQWIREGFEQHGFPVSSPADDSFISVLIGASHPKYQPEHIRTNALRMLAALPAQTVLRLAGSLSASADVSSRRAALAALERVPGEARLAVLRTLTRDRDIDVAENALRTLNSALRLALPALVPDSVWDVPLAEAGIHVLHVLNERTVVLGIGYGIVDETRVVGFDLAAHKVTWAYATGDAVRKNAVRIGDRLYFVSDDRVVHCISIDGKPRWARPLTSNPDLGMTGPAIIAVGDRLFVPDDKSVYVVTLSGQIQAYALGARVSRNLVQGRHKVFGAIHNGPLLLFDDAGSPRRVPTGLKTAALSASSDVVCIVSFGPPYVLQCLDEETLRERWRVELPIELGAYDTLQQDADHVYVLAQGRALAFDLATGERRWASNEFRSFAFFKVVGRTIMTESFESFLEWRDSSSGEVIAVMRRRGGTYVTGAVRLDEAVLVETRDTVNGGDDLRLLRLPDAFRHRLTRR